MWIRKCKLMGEKRRLDTCFLRERGVAIYDTSRTICIWCVSVYLWWRFTVVYCSSLTFDVKRDGVSGITFHCVLNKNENAMLSS